MKVAMPMANIVPSITIMPRLPHQIIARLSTAPTGSAETSRTRCSVTRGLHRRRGRSGTASLLPLFVLHLFLLRPEPSDAGDARENRAHGEHPRVEDGADQADGRRHSDNEWPDGMIREFLAMVGIRVQRLRHQHFAFVEAHAD